MPKVKDLELKNTKKTAPVVEEEEKEIDPDLLLGDEEVDEGIEDGDLSDLEDDSEDSDPFGDRWEE